MRHGMLAAAARPQLVLLLGVRTGLCAEPVIGPAHTLAGLDTLQ